MKGQDILGNIAILKFGRGESAAKKKKEALEFMREHRNVKTALEKSDKFKGRLRTLKAKYIAGEKTKEALYRENGCEFRLNVESCYFSPRLASERKEIADMTEKGESVLVMFGGVAPFAIVIAKTKKPALVVSVELGKECCKYAAANVKRNKLEGNVEIIQGDVRKVLPKMAKKKMKFERIVMARPNLKDSFLDAAFPLAKKRAVIHYYGFYEANKAGEMKSMIDKEAGKAGRKIKIMRIKKAGDIGVRKFRYRADVKVVK
jgi:tRNA (guanine37-N1)-methyltransferase